MTDAEIIASARETEVRALFAVLFKSLSSGEAPASAVVRFSAGLRLLAEAEKVALEAVQSGGSK